MKRIKPVKPANAPLTVVVDHDQLVIRIGVATLAYALQNGPQSLGAKIWDARGFARDIATELERNDDHDDHDGHNSHISALLEKCAQNAIEWGSQHVHCDGDCQPSVYPPERHS